jgi:hypothetical protein
LNLEDTIARGKKTMAAGTKRDRDGNARSKTGSDLPRGRFHAMFETFRDELDEHYDRRERIVKASRDVTAQSKKMYVSTTPFPQHKLY